MRLRTYSRAAIVGAALLLLGAPAFAQNFFGGGGISAPGGINVGTIGITPPIDPVTVGAAAPGNCPTSPQQFEIADTTAGPLCLQIPFSAISGTALNSQLAGPLVSALAVPAQFTISNPGGVGTATVGYTANTLAAHNFGTGIDLTGKLTGAQPAFTDVSGTATDAQLANGYSGTGACAANKFETADNRNAAPTCTQPATTNLSDVSTGTWTPTVQGSSTAGTATYAFQYGRYIKIGPLVIADFEVHWSTFTGATGGFELAGLPFANAVIGAGNANTENHVSAMVGITLDTGYTTASLEIASGLSVADLLEDGSGKSKSYPPVANIAGVGRMAGTLIYRNN